MRGNVLGSAPQVDSPLRRRAPLERYPRTPFRCRPDRAWHETAAAVRANILELALDAIRTERALIAANSGVHRIWRKIPIAKFAVGPELQRHGFASRSRTIIANQVPDAMTNNPRFQPSSLAMNGMNGALRLRLPRRRQFSDIRAGGLADR